MCCFSGPVRQVGDTRIFARLGDGGNQVLIYQMKLDAPEPVAMILPLPVKPDSGEQAVTFFSFERYPRVFLDLEKGFPVNDPFGGSPSYAKAPAAAPKLAVETVGAFHASYVPGIADFARLDERFRLPEGVWEKLPGYRTYGFAVFQLRPGHFISQPLALAFPTALPGHLFFPTVHIHDGKVHAKETFDHSLYCQLNGQEAPSWAESSGLALQHVNIDLTHGMVRPRLHVRKLTLMGKRDNEDIILKPGQA